MSEPIVAVCPRCGAEGPKTEQAEYARQVAESVFGSPQPRIMLCPDCKEQFRLTMVDDD